MRATCRTSKAQRQRSPGGEGRSGQLCPNVTCVYLHFKRIRVPVALVTRPDGFTRLFFFHIRSRCCPTPRVLSPATLGLTSVVDLTVQRLRTNAARRWEFAACLRRGIKRCASSCDSCLPNLVAGSGPRLQAVESLAVKQQAQASPSMLHITFLFTASFGKPLVGYLHGRRLHVE